MKAMENSALKTLRVSHSFYYWFTYQKSKVKTKALFSLVTLDIHVALQRRAIPLNLRFTFQ